MSAAQALVKSLLPDLNRKANVFLDGFAETERVAGNVAVPALASNSGDVQMPVGSEVKLDATVDMAVQFAELKTMVSPGATVRL
jgi:hypothetical protein